MLAGTRCGLLASTLLLGCAAPPPETSPTLDEGAAIRGDRSRRELALLFTGGAFGEGTGAVLDALRRRGLPAAFFLTGEYLAVPEQRAMVRTMLADGHYVGPHSDAHLLYCAWEDRRRNLVDEATFRTDLQRNIEDLRALGALPDGSPTWFVPPYEWFNRDQVAWAASIGVRLVNFTPGSGSNRDYIPEGEPGFVPSSRIRDEVLAFERTAPDGLNGFLLLLHLGSARRDKMHAELGALVDAILARGYRFVRIDALLPP
jgi:peptidoglycan/xylan/chitin deacetylase (PgdA/CDA1 family)